MDDRCSHGGQAVFDDDPAGRWTAPDLRGISPQKVAEVVAQALTTPHPKPRYKAGLDVRVQMVAFALMGDRVRDRLMARMTGLALPNR